MHRNRYLSLLALLLALCLCLCGCSGGREAATENADILLPEPEAGEPRQILGLQNSQRTRDITLHYAGEDSLSLGTMVRSLTLQKDETRIQAALRELMSSAALSGTVEAELLGVEAGSGVVTVNLSIEAGVNRTEQDYLLLCASIANTLLELEDVQAVNVLTGGRSDPLCNLPLGVFTAIEDNIAAAYARTQSEAERFPADAGTGIERNALLYFPAADDQHLLPEVRQLHLENRDYASAILQQLSEGPLMRSCCFSAVPQNMDLLEGTPQLLVTEQGERIVELNFTAALSNYLDFAGMESWQLYGSLVLSLCSFLPETDAVRICIDGAPVISCEMGGVSLQFEDGLMRRSDYAHAIGGSADLYFADDQGALTRAEIPMTRSAAISPLQLMQELVSAEAPENLFSVFPEGIHAGDILGISVQDKTAQVNLSANFYARCQALDARQERLLIYAMVNTLTQLNEIGAAAFLVEGEQVESLAQSIYLKTPLLPDPGLLQ